MFNCNLIVLSYHRFTSEDDEYRFSRTYDQFGHDINKKVYDIITIDDGMKCMIKACDMMRERNIRAKLFICTGLIGERGYCNWDDIIALSRYHDIENHSHIHKYHSRLEHHEIYENISKANDLITHHIGKVPRYFVAPYNNYDERVDEIANDLELVPVKNRVNILNISK